MSPGPPLGEVLLFLGLLAAFTWPGFRAVGLLDREGWHRSWERVAIGFVLSFGTFSAVTGPLLLMHHSSSTALIATLAVWAGGTAALELAHRKQTRSRLAEALEREDGGVWPSGGFALGAIALGLASLAASAALCFGFPSRSVGLGLCVLAFCGNAFVAVAGLRHTEREARPPSVALPRWTWLIVAAFAAFQLYTATLYVREDMDDTLYLSEALVLQSTNAMGVEAPTHRGEGLPPTPVYAWQAFELFAAQLCRLSGLHPMIAMRTVLAPIVLALAWVLYSAILRRLLPRWALPLALIIVAAYLTFGMSSHNTANNFLMPRPQQGKTWLMHVAIPALVILAGAYLTRPRVGSLLLVLGASFAALGFSSTAVFLVPALAAVLAASHLLVGPERRIGAAGLLALAVLPEVFFGLYLLSQEAGLAKEIALSWSEAGRWRDQLLFMHLNLEHGGGVLEIFALVALPQLALLWPGKERAAYPLVFTLLLFATVLNPLLFSEITERFTGTVGYERFMWLVPFPILLGALVAGWAGMALAAGARWVGAVAVVGCLIAAMPLIGSHYVWGRSNVYFEDVRPIEPYRAENAYKMPSGLLEIARQLQRERVGEERRILCSERSCSHLAPFDTAFDFVFTRGYQTAAPLAMLGRSDEAAERERAARNLLQGEIEASEAEGLLERTKTAFVVIDEPSEPLERTLEALGFSRDLGAPPYALWVRRSKTQRNYSK